MGNRGALGGIRRETRRMAIAVCACALMLSWVTSASAAVPSGNLLQNPGAEAGSCSHDTSTPPPIPDWTTTLSFTVLCYADDITLDPALSSNGGNNYFMGGDEESTTATQTVDISSGANEIDGGSVHASLAADLGGFAEQNDNMIIIAVFLSGSEQPLGSPLVIGPVIAVERNEESKLVHREASAAVPAGPPPISTSLGLHASSM